MQLVQLIYILIHVFLLFQNILFTFLMCVPGFIRNHLFVPKMSFKIELISEAKYAIENWSNTCCKFSFSTTGIHLIWKMFYNRKLLFLICNITQCYFFTVFNQIICSLVKHQRLFKHISFSFFLYVSLWDLPSCIVTGCFSLRHSSCVSDFRTPHHYNLFMEVWLKVTSSAECLPGVRLHPVLGHAGSHDKEDNAMTSV